MKKLMFAPTVLIVLGLAITLLYDAPRPGSAIGLLLVLSAPMVAAGLLIRDGAIKQTQFRYEMSAFALGIASYSACLLWPNFFLFLLGVILVFTASISMQVEVIRRIRTA